MENLPAELTVDILLRLPVNTIIHCKRVCKKWRNLVSDSSFVNLHLSGSPTTVGLLIDNSRGPGILKWLEVIKDKDDLHHDPPMSLDLNMIPILQNSSIYQRGSVNGLICLRQYSHGRDNTYVCNPVTREILITPTPPQYNKHCCAIIAYGFGVGSLTGEYKVVRTLNRSIPLNGNKSKVVSEAEAYTLGTGQWRSLGRLHYTLYRSDVGAVLNDHCHWIVSDRGAPEKICTFDLNRETFQLFPSPPPPPSGAIEEFGFDFESLAILKGCLCKSDGNHSQFTIWMMKEYGIKKSWHKEVVITKEALNRSREWPYWYTVSLIEGLEDGTIFFMSRGLWAFYPRTDTVEEIGTFTSSESGLTYRPSFLKLQNFGLERVHVF